MTTIRDVYRIEGQNATAAAFREVVRNSEAAASKVSRAFRSALGTVSAVAIARTLQGWNRQAIEQADALATLAQSFGISTEAMSRFDYVAKQTNTTLEQVSPGLVAFQKNLALAGEGSGRAREALADLNIDAAHLARIPLPRQLEEVAEAFRGVTNPTERVRIAAQLFGDEVGRRMIPILARGRDGLRALGDESDRVGATLTKEMAAKLQATDAEMKKLEASSMLLKRELALGLGPAVVTIGEIFNTAARGALNFGEALAAAFHGADEPVQILQDRLGELAERRNELVAWIRQAPQTEASESLVAKFREQLRDVEAEMNRVNAALQQFGRDAQAYETFKPVEESAQKAASAVAILRGLIDDIRASSEIDIRIQDAQLDAPLGPSMAENAREVAATMRDINSENIELRERTIQIGQAFEDLDGSAKDFMATISDELGRRALGTLSDLIYNMGNGAKNFGDQMIDAFRRIMADQAARALFEMLGNWSAGRSGSGGLLGAIASGIGSLFGAGSGSSGGGSSGGFRGLMAAGGSLRPGQWGIVGEKGPEIALGGTYGRTIVPFSKASAQRNVTIAPVFAPVINVDSRADREAVRQDTTRIVQSAIGQFNEHWRDQLSRGAYA